MKKKSVAKRLIYLLYWLVRPGRLVLGYILHGKTFKKSEDFNYAVAVDWNITSILMSSLISNDRSLAVGDVTSALTHNVLTFLGVASEESFFAELEDVRRVKNIHVYLDSISVHDVTFEGTVLLNFARLSFHGFPIKAVIFRKATPAVTSNAQSDNFLSKYI